MLPLLPFLASSHDAHLQYPARGGGRGAYLVPEGEVSHGVLSCQGDAAEQDEKQDQVGEDVVVNNSMAVDTKPETERKDMNLSLERTARSGKYFPPSLLPAGLEDCPSEHLPPAPAQPVQGSAGSPH